MTAPYGALTVGRLTLTEDWQVPESAGADDRTVTLQGQECSAVAGSQAAVRERAEGLLAMAGRTVPVTWTAQPHRNGWYTVGTPSATESTWWNDTIVDWQCPLTRVGWDAEVEIESRLVGGNRSHAATGASAELWHAPAVSGDAYYVGSSTPGYVDRVGAGGTVRVFRAIPAATNPRWSVSSTGYLAGAVTLTVAGTVRTGLTCADTPASWSVSNGLLKVEPRTSTGTLIVTSYLTSGWGAPKVFDVKRGAVSLGAAKHVTVVRNDPCEVILRLTWDHAPGRSTLDVSIKRGSRFVGLHVQQYAAAAALRVDDNGGGGTVSDQLTAAGYILRTDPDGDGNRWLIGSPLACTAAGTFGLTASTPALSLPAFIGCERAGAGAAAGDTAAVVNSQYLGAASETERVILR